MKRISSTVQYPLSAAATSRGTVVADFGKDAFGWLEVASGAGIAEVRAGEALDASGGVDPAPGESVRAATAKCPAAGSPESGFAVVPFPPDKRNTEGVNGKARAVRLPPRLPVVMPFRYVEILRPAAGTGSEAAALEGLRRRVVHAPMDMAASAFDCDDPRLVRVYDFCKNTIQATSFAGVYIDGDRERIPYEADAWLNQLGHLAVEAEYGMARRTFRHLLAHPTWPTEWAQFMVSMAWNDWMHSGSGALARRHWRRLRGEKLLLGLARPDGLLVSFPDCGCGGAEMSDIVDWPPCERDGFDFTPVNAVVNALHFRNLGEMRDLALAIGETADAAFLEKRAAAVRRAYNRAFWRERASLYADGEATGHASLHANAAALACGLVPARRTATVADFLVRKGMACSVYFSQFMLEALFKAGRAADAIALMSAGGDRSWLGMMEQGATMTMEAWNGVVKPNQDWNHAWGTAPLNVLSRFVLGVRPAAPGFAACDIAPQPGPLRRLSGTVPTPRGPVRLDLSFDGRGGVRGAVALPPGAAGAFRWRRRAIPLVPGGETAVEL